MEIGDDTLYSPIPPVLWAYAPDDGTWAASIHKAYVRELLRERGFPERLGLLARCLLSPLVIAGATTYLTWHNGSTIRRRTGRSIVGQVADQMKLGWRHGIWSPWYYMFELYRDENRGRASDYLMRYETKHALYELLKVHVERTGGQFLNNKAIFAEHCARHGLPTAEVVAIIEDGRLRASWSDDGSSKVVLPEADLFAKPMSGKGGRGTLRARWAGGRYELSDGMTMTAVELIAHLEALSQENSVLVQRCLINHRDILDLTAGALSCVRTVTCRNETGGFEVTNAAFRMAMRDDTTVDGLHRGGLATKVDIRTGVLGHATDLGMMPGVGWCDTNPYSGVPIAGRVLPCWQDLIALAERAHAAFPWKVAVGWDIAITDDGPMLVEGNGSPCVDIIQRVERAPMGTQRFGELLAWHVERAIEARDHAGTGV